MKCAHCTHFDMKEKMKTIGTCSIFNIDCLEYMKTIPDKFFNLAIVDPPYFAGPNKANYYRNGVESKTKATAGVYKALDNWSLPDQQYFDELFRVSKHQIIWGINYYEKFVNCNGRIVWDKENGESSFSDAEIASCSLIDSVRMFRYRWSGMIQANMKNREIRIHPTQKPVALYEWTLAKFASTGDKILDTHLGSGSSAIAAVNLGYEFYGTEIDEHYFQEACKRIEAEQKQCKLFESAVPVQESLI